MSLESVRERMTAAAARSSRAPDSVVLVIVTKGQSVNTISELYDRGSGISGRTGPRN